MDANPPLVTAILVCWNHERFVRASIIAAVSQTYPNIQLIVFDNDSSDGSRKIIEPLAEEYGFTFIHQPNVGLVKTLNRALKLARGKYFTLLATDDIWLLDKVERQVAFMEANPTVDLVCGHLIVIDENDNEIDWPIEKRPGEATFESLMCVGNNVQGSTVMGRTEALRAVGGYDESLPYEDFPMALQLTSAGRRVVNTGEVYTRYRRHGGNWTQRPIFDEQYKVAQHYRHTPEYRTFVRKGLRGYFRWLAAERKHDAVRLLLNEPIEWSFFDVGVGLVKLLVPVPAFRLLKILRRKA